MWLTMPKADTNITNAEWVICVTSIIMDAKIDLVDFNRGNFAKLDGDIVCIDYGTGTRNIDSQHTYSQEYELLVDTIRNMEDDIE
jgi:hypothetical protein